MSRKIVKSRYKTEQSAYAVLTPRLLRDKLVLLLWVNHFHQATGSEKIYIRNREKIYCSLRLRFAIFRQIIKFHQ